MLLSIRVRQYRAKQISLLNYFLISNGTKIFLNSHKIFKSFTKTDSINIVNDTKYATAIAKQIFIVINVTYN